jgi:hypothetical protein
MLDDSFQNIVQTAADYSGLEQEVYQRRDGSLLYCAKGNRAGLDMVLQQGEPIKRITTIKPSYWPKDK